MRVLLVSPKSHAWTSRKHLPLGLGYLAAMLEQAGHAVAIYDATVEDAPLDAVLDRGFDLVGVSAVTSLIYEAWDVAAQAKSRGCATILGGPHLTLMPDESLAQPQVDLVARGEAEDTILEVMDYLAGRRDLSGILGLSYKQADGALVHNPLRPLRKDLDSLPFPAHHLFKIDRYANLQPLTDGLDPHARAFSIITSRGCPYHCIYCSKAVTGNTWRPRSPANVVAEWRWLVRDLHATEIGVTDDVMTLNVDRAKDICRRLIAEGLNTVPWITVHGMRVNNADAELFLLMKQAGCKRVGFGVESGNQRVLDYMKKKQTIAEVRQAFRWAKAAGLQTMGFFILGLPTETEATMEDTIRLALELDPDLGNFMMAAPFPGTELYDIVQREGRLLDHNWTDAAIHDERAHYEMGDLTAELVERKWHQAYRRFYMRPSRIWRKATSLETWRHLPRYVTDVRRFLGF